MNYSAFSDESYISAERYRSICSFSHSSNYHEEIKKEIQRILSNSDVNEFKWEKLRTAKYRFCAQKLIDFVCNNLHRYDIRLDILIWDTSDSRHDITNRDDIANFERLFFHLMKYSMTRRQNDSKWNIYPDERLEIDWETIRQCLSSVGRWQKNNEYPLIGNFLSDPNYKIDEFCPVKSHEEPCCQVADLFAGISVFSKTAYSKYIVWEKHQSPALFNQQNPTFSNSEAERFQVMKHFNNKCKNIKLGVSLKSNRCFATHDPRNPINFWHYCPQHHMDKAPTRNK